MKSLQTIQGVLVFGLSMAGWGVAHAANVHQPDEQDHLPAEGRMSMSFSSNAAWAAARNAQQAPAAPAAAAPSPVKPTADAAALSMSMQAPIEDMPPTAAGVRAPAKPASASAAVIKEGEQRFDIVVRNASAAQLFGQLGAGSNYNMLVPPDVTGSVSLNLRNTTLTEALDTLRDMYGYDYRITGNRIFISSNAVQTRLFRINYLPGRRTGSSELSISSAATATASASAGGGATSGSASSSSGGAGSGSYTGGGGASLTSSVRMTSEADFWKEVNESLASMIGTKDGRSVNMNPGAGVILVRATPMELRQVTEYLRALQIIIERQVMLEAKIVEVQLNKSYDTGINWGLFRSEGLNGGQVGLVNMMPGVSLTKGGLTTTSTSVVQGTGVTTTGGGKGFYGLSIQTPNFAALLNFLETQGDVQVLSSPRIAALNNQKAVLKVGSDDTFVTSVTNNVTVVNNTTVNSPTVGTKTYFSGISLDVTPQIDDTGTVMLHVHPAISVATTKDLSLKLGDSGTYQVPGVAVSINETDSMVRVKDGQIVAIGGLMQASGSVGTAGLPGLSKAPVIGGLFRQKSESSSKRELVILIKPTIISEDGSGSNPAVPATSMLEPGTASASN